MGAGEAEADAPEAPEILSGEGDGVLGLLIRIYEDFLRHVLRALRTHGGGKARGGGGRRSLGVAIVPGGYRQGSRLAPGRPGAERKGGTPVVGVPRAQSRTKCAWRAQTCGCPLASGS
eukprot:scaffold5143_cov119-Isochrysis_galbana.AAC.17